MTTSTTSSPWRWTRDDTDIFRLAVPALGSLAAGPLYRLRLIRLAPGEHAIVLTLHHIIADAWSLDVLMAELHHSYNGEPLPPLSVQYTDYAWWQQERSAGASGASMLAYWERVLADLPARLRELGADAAISGMGC